MDDVHPDKSTGPTREAGKHGEHGTLGTPGATAKIGATAKTGALAAPRMDGLVVLVLGLGASGAAMARWCAHRGADVRLWDTRDDPPAAVLLQAELPHLRRLTGPLDAAALAGVRLVLKSPGLAPHDGRIAPALAYAAEHGVPVQGELGLFVQGLGQLPDGERPQVVAVTGTNGKTTTTAMTAAMLARAGRRVAVAGNIGPTLLQTLDAALAAHADGTPLPDVWVLELSSFQLDGVDGFLPTAAALLNLTEDHLDWHDDMGRYAAAKARIFGPATVRVLNRDDTAVWASRDSVVAPAPDAKATAPVERPASGSRKRRSATPLPTVVGFGTSAPMRAGDFGVVDDDGVAWLVRADAASAPARVDAVGAAGAAGASGPVGPADAGLAASSTLRRLMPLDDLQVRGRHNAANALAALALATAVGAPLAPLLHALREYRGEPHRVQHVATVDGIDAYDDSKGTNVGATVAAVDGLGGDKAPGRLVVLIGGDGKGQDFAPLAAPLLRHARAVATLGRDAHRIEAAIAAPLADAGIGLARHATLEAATRWSFDQARVGDAVLLSPACASLDMFRDYAHRAEVFVAAVTAWADEQRRTGVPA